MRLGSIFFSLNGKKRLLYNQKKMLLNDYLNLVKVDSGDRQKLLILISYTQKKNSVTSLANVDFEEPAFV